ncbi:MAG: hypothetical protein ACREIA_23810 [Opitutaceae bacterium]
MDDREATAAYDAAGMKGAPGAGVRWPDIDLAAGNLRRLFEGVLDERLDLAELAFGEQANRADAAEQLEEAWRLEAMHTRFAPEGVYVRAKFSVRIRLLDDAAPDDPSEDEVWLGVEGELCLSFATRQHTRPFVDFMGGSLRIEERTGDATPVATEKRLDPFALMVSPQLAVAWGLNAAPET